MADARVAVLADYIRGSLRAGTDTPLEPDTPLLSRGVLDSMGIVMLAAFAEERFGVRIDDADLRAGGIETIADLLALIDSRR